MASPMVNGQAFPIDQCCWLDERNSPNMASPMVNGQAFPIDQCCWLDSITITQLKPEYNSELL
jgi:hypothetical protein